MKSENLIKVSIDSWGCGLRVTCGNTTRDFKNVHWQTAGFIIGFAMWCKDNEWAVEEAFKDCDEENVQEVMLSYATEALNNKSTGFCDCCTKHKVRLNDDSTVVNDNPYFRLLEALDVKRPEPVETREENGVWSRLVRLELKREAGNA